MDRTTYCGGVVLVVNRVCVLPHRVRQLALVIGALTLLIYGLAGTSDIETAVELTAGVDRAEVMAWAKAR